VALPWNCTPLILKFLTTTPLNAVSSISHSDRLNQDLQFQDKLAVYRVVTAGLLCSLLWKARYIPFFFSTYRSIPLQDTFFPPLWQDPSFLALLFLCPIGLGLGVLFFASRTLLLVQSVVTVICLFGLSIHQQSYNDVTFVTCFWVGLWQLWFAIRIGEAAETLYPKGGFLAAAVFSLMFLGGAIGKLTPGYWSGEVFYEIYFANRNYWIFTILRGNFSPENLKEISLYYSRLVIIVELLGGGLWLLPTRWACGAGILIFLSIALMSNTNLFSVMSCLLGLGVAGLHRPKPVPPMAGQKSNPWHRDELLLPS